MGNSGSMHGLSSYEEGYHHAGGVQGYHHHHQRYHDAMRGEAGGGPGSPSSWMDAYQRGEHGRRAGGTPRDYDYHHHHHLHELKVDDGHFPGSPQHQQQQQIKVLPDIPGKVAKLRSTNNGNILHAGGTISKNNQALQRSKSISSPTYQQHQQQQQQHHASFSECDEDVERNAMAPRLPMTRSRTQLNMVGPGRGRDELEGPPGKGAGGAEHRSARRPQYPREPSPRSSADAAALNHRKRFGSEPDLRLTLAPRLGAAASGEQPAGGGPRKPSTAQSKIMKGKNKKRAPGPPLLLEKDRPREPSKGPDRQRIIAYSPLRRPTSETNTSTLPSSGETGYNVAATRKLRLFKTRAETKKTPTIAKLPEASDAKFSSAGGAALMKHGAPAAAPFRSSSTSSSSSQLVLAQHHQPRAGQHVRQQQQQQQRTERTERSERPVDAPGDQEQHCVAALDRISPRPNPASFFRREKTFDAGLLGLERQRAVEPPPRAKPTLSPPLSRRKSIIKSLLEQEGNGRAAEERKREAPAAAAVPITDFQKELQLATRRAQGGPAHATPCRIHIANAGPGEAPSRAAPKAKAPAAAALLIPVASAKEAEQEPTVRAEPLAADARDSSPPATPPPPPPPPKTSFYFGMSRQRDARAEQSDRSLPSCANERLAEYLAERKAQTAQRLAESRVDDSDGPDEEGRSLAGAAAGAGAEQEADGRSTPDEIGHTQMELIDQFAASLLNGSRFRSSDSVASSEADVRMGRDAWDEGHQEIALKLRPTLPRKQFDIPRFSPAAAWRLLTTEDEFCRDSGDVIGGGGGGTGPHDDLGGVGVGVGGGCGGIGGGGSSGGGDKKAFLRGAFEQELEVPEDRIQRVYREPVPGLQDNKSGDSGISGDAGLPDLGEQPLLKERAGGSTPESGSQRMLQPRDIPAEDAPHGGDGGGGGGRGDGGGWSSNALLLMPWTPQQDLEDDDDSSTGSGSEPPPGQLIEDGADDPGAHGDGPGSYSSKGHLFSLSLPRENHLSIYNVEVNDEKVEKHVFNSLQKFRKSVSSAFKGEESGTVDTNDNWFLGRLDTGTGGVARAGSGGPEKRQKLIGSQPTSYTSLDRSASRERDAGGGGAGATVATATQSKHCSIGYLVSGKHMMYLPREPTKTVGHERAAGGKQDQNNNSRTYRNQNGGGGGSQAGPQQQQQQSSLAASVAHKETPRKSPPVYGSGDKENLQDPVPAGGASGELEHFPVKLTNRRNHRFTFQSTIRQIEKRRVAEKLSREAEIKEAMRLSELEAMRRVEEEFQKKRAREKASIRHQLRLFSMENQPDQQQQQQQQHHDDGQHDDGEHDLTGDNTRSDPDGDSLPHQNTGGGGGRGLYRRKEFTSMERQRQSKRANGQLREDVAGVRSAHAVGSFHHFQQQHANSDDEEERVVSHHHHHRQHQPGERFAAEDDDVVDEGDGDGDGDSSSLGYVDTRTPYISRIIQAKSSKAYGVRK